MTLDEIKTAVNEGLTVCWGNDGYRVICDSIGQWMITFLPNGHCFHLTNRTGKLECKEADFYILSE
jgi:hypothetical protein